MTQTAINVPVSDELHAEANGITICYQTMGDPADPPVLLIMGLGAQMVAWPDDLCKGIAARGYYVIRFDNRDSGHSTRFDSHDPPGRLDLALMAAGLGRDRLAYTMQDMVGDAAGLLDALGIESTHIVGASLGGMIAQILAIRYPDRVRTMTCMMSSHSTATWPPPRSRAIKALLTPTPRDLEGRKRWAVEYMKVMGGGAPVDAQEIEARAEATHHRATKFGTGALRQAAAVITAPSRKAALASIDTPTLVIHGRLDPLIPLRNGAALARAIPNARLIVVDEMGHSLPGTAWPTIIDAIAEHAQ